MGGNLSIKQFKCPIHPTENISKCVKNPYATRLLYCYDCLLEQSNYVSQGSLLELKQLMDYVCLQMYTIKPFRVQTKSPESLFTSLKQEEELVKKFAEQISVQKTKVVERMDKLESELSEIVKKTKQQLIFDLDRQLEIFKFNFEIYKKKISNTFTMNCFMDDEEETKTTLFTEVNSCENSIQFEIKLRDYLFQIEASQAIRTSEIDEVNVLESVKVYKKNFESFLNRHPQSFVLDDSEYETQEAKIKNFVESSTKDLIKMKNQVKLLSECPTDSLILSSVDLESIMKLTMPKCEDFLFQLLLRARKDGSNLTEIHRTFKKKSNVLLVVKTHKGNIQGCFKFCSTNEHHPESIITYDLNKRITRKEYLKNDKGKNDGFYEFSEQFILTYPKHSGMNPEMLGDLRRLKVDIVPEEHICLIMSMLERDETEVIETREQWDKILSGANEIELFKLTNPSIKKVN